MSVTTPEARTRNGEAPASYGREEPQGSGAGWLTFAGAMVLILGIVNTIGGIAAVENANFFTATGVHYQIGTLSAWGWIIMVVGVAQVLAAFSIWAGNAYGRWVGAISAGANVIAQLYLMASFPLWSMSLIGLDVLVIYGLVVYGGRTKASL